jgi:O-antigen ligase
MYPIVVDSLSINYSFLLLPLGFAILRGRIRKPAAAYLVAMALFTLIFVTATLYQYEWLGEGDRRIASFALFMTLFAYMFIKIDDEMVQSFKTALVGISLLLTIISVYLFFTSGGSALGFEAKDVAGSSRVGFVYLLGIWVTYFSRPAKSLGVAFRYVVLATLLVGLLLTFSRASIVALAMSFGLFAIVSSVPWLKRPSFGGLRRGLFLVVGAVALVALLQAFVPLAFEFFEARLYERLLDAQEVQEDLADPNVSEGKRLVFLRTIIEFVMRNPLTGSGFLGIWSITDVIGSAHNQYADVLLRTGIVGFAVYMLLLAFLGRHLYRTERDLFWGYVAVLSYGLFHETFKESQGAFVLAFMLGMLSQSTRAIRARSGSAAGAPPTGKPLAA